MASRLVATFVLMLAASWSSVSAAEPARSPVADAFILPNGLALPYPTLRVFRAFGRCKGKGKRPAKWRGAWRSHEHEGIDLGGLGPDGGLGSAVRSMTRARVVEIAHGDDLPPKFGITDRRDGTCMRDGTSYPRSFALAGYGDVFFFTRARGWYRTGNMVVTVGLDGRLANHRVRYMHLGMARPDLKIGDVVEAGEEIGIMGGTAVQDADPHVHIDIRDPDGESVDVAPLIGLVTSAWCGVPRTQALVDARAFKAVAKIPWRATVWPPPVGVPGRAGRVLPTIDLLRTPGPLVAAGVVPAGARFWHDAIVAVPCGTKTIEEDFSSGAYAGHAWRLRVARGQTLEVQIAARDEARMAIVDETNDRVPTAEVAAEGITLAAIGAGHVQLTAAATTVALVVVLAQSGTYTLTVRERCKAAK